MLLKMMADLHGKGVEKDSSQKEEACQGAAEDDLHGKGFSKIKLKMKF
jgi:hypothetical protein